MRLISEHCSSSAHFRYGLSEKRKFVTHGAVLSSIMIRGLITEKGVRDGR